MRIPQPGDVLADKYHLVEVLGEGGFGVVLRGTTELTDRAVAVKILKPSSGGYEMTHAARFLREMATIARLQSPHTLTLYDYGRTDEGVLFMVCEFIEGEDLLELLTRRETLEEHEVIWVLYQILISLAEAHQLGVLHRDIKPANIRLFEYGNDPLRVKVLDFGLARAIEPGRQASLTATNRVIGTPRYMAPEQLTGEPLSAATDLYAAGLLAAEMLVGRQGPAFRDFRPGRKTQLSEEDGVSEALQQILNRMLERDPTRRFRTATDVLTALRPLRRRGHLPQVSPTTSLPSEDPTTTRAAELLPVALPTPQPQVPTRGRQSLILAAGALVIFVAAIAFSFSTSTSPRPQVHEPVPAIASELLRTAQPEPTPDVVPDQGLADSGGVVDAGPRLQGCGTAAGPGFVSLDESAGLTYVPAGYDVDVEHPVVVFFGASARAAKLKGFADTADKYGFVLLAPAPGLRAAKQLFDAASEKLCIDESRAYAIADKNPYIRDVKSRSTAANVAERFSCEVPLAGIATRYHLSTPASYPCTPDPRTARLLILGVDDGHTPRRGGRHCSLANTLVPSWDSVDESWRALHRCDDEKETFVREKSGQCHRWSCGAATYARCSVEGGRQGTDRCAGGFPSKFPWFERSWRFFRQQPPRKDAR